MRATAQQRPTITTVIAAITAGGLAAATIAVAIATVTVVAIAIIDCSAGYYYYFFLPSHDSCD